MKFTKCLTAAAISLLANTASASSIWEPTNSDTDFLTFSFFGISLNGAMLGLFDDSDVGTYAGPFLLIGDNVGGEVRFTNNGSNVLANSFSSTGAQVDGTLTLTNSSLFTLAVSYDEGETWLGDTTSSIGDSPDSYLIQFDHRQNPVASSIAVDLTAASVVPVPASVWLFGSGLLGLVGIARRKV